MIQLNKTQIVLSFVTLAALRIAIGFHFFDQGHSKFQTGGFDSSGFLNAAEGPFEGLFHAMIPDRDGRIRLCFDPLKEGPNKIDPEKTLKIWENYKNYVVEELIKEEKRLVKRRERTRAQLEKADPDSEEYMVFNNLYQKDEERILAIRRSREAGAANRIFADYREQLTSFLMDNEEEINYYFLGASRLEGFERDSQIAAEDSVAEKEEIKREAAENVNLLRQQVKTIEYDRKSTAAGWLATIDAMWKGFEYELLNMVPLDEDRKDELRIDLPTDSEMITLINGAIPYFDMTIGSLLILGLFTRFAAMGGGLFILSVLMTQPAILGEAASPTNILYLVEMLGAFVLAATCAGRYAGLDYFLNSAIRRLFSTKDEESV